jgi:hypothetical protein
MNSWAFRVFIPSLLLRSYGGWEGSRRIDGTAAKLARSRDNRLAPPSSAPPVPS